MINLLLPEQKRELRAARRNVILLRYTFLGIAAMVFMLGIFGVGFVVTTNEQSQAQAELAEHEVTSAKFKEVQKRATAFENNLKTADAILSGEILFSDVIIQIARTVPSGVVLTSLHMDTESFGDEVAINARTKLYDGPLALKAALEESKLFEDVSIVDISKVQDNSADITGIQKTHPFATTLNATLTKSAAKQSTTGSQQ